MVGHGCFWRDVRAVIFNCWRIKNRVLGQSSKGPFGLGLGLPLVLGLSICLVLGCSHGPSQNKLAASSEIGGSKMLGNEKENIELWPSLSSPIKKDPALEARIAELLALMTLEQKVGQMTQAEITWVTAEEVKQYHLGSVLHGGGSFLNDNREASAAEWVAFIDTLYHASMDTSEGGLAIPIIYGTDAVHGHNKIIGATLFPHNIGLGAASNPELIKKIGEVTAKEVLVTGMDWTFAPALSVVRNDRWGRSYEGYSEDPELVVAYAGKMVEGLQGAVNSHEFMGDSAVISCAKHYVADGGTEDGIDQGNALASEQALIRLHAAGYFSALEAGVQSIMASHSAWKGLKMHGHHYLLTEVLKSRLGFDGFVVGDWNAHGAVEGCTNDSCPASINAGVDLFMAVEDWKAFIANTVRQVKDGVIPETRIDDAVTRILRVKIRSGLFDKGAPSERAFSNKLDHMGSQAHRAVARQAVRESLVLLKNNGQVLPLKPTQKVLVAGDGANNIGKQAGGWTINWTGEGNKNEDFPGATSIYDGIKDVVQASGGSVVLSESPEHLEAQLSGSNKPDAAIVVFGEPPYAEWGGDLTTIAYQRYSHLDAQLLESIKAHGIPVVSIFLSGRPLWVNRELNASDAFVAAWLPGSEGVGVADVIFSKADGSVNADFVGKLSFSWPQKASQVDLNVGDADYEPLFAYGYGLNYRSVGVEVPSLSIDNDVVVDANNSAIYDIFNGRLREPWQFALADDEGIDYLDTLRASNSAVTIREADKLAQGDARDILWSGDGWGMAAVASSWNREGLAHYIEAGAALTFDIRVDELPTAPLMAGIVCGHGSCGGIPLNDLVSRVPRKTWQSVSIDLLCLAEEGAHFEAAGGPFSLSTSGRAAVRVANIRYAPGLAATADIRCAAK